MYEYIKGSITSLSHTAAVVEASGVGYILNISLTSYAQIEGKTNATLYTHLYIIQDSAPVLYGFTTREERELFRLLISVSGIGAGTARIMLSSHSPSELASALATGNTAILTSIKGIGAKTAEVAIVKLRDKVLHINGIEAGEGSSSDAGREALDALQVLGFSKVATEKVVKKLVSENPNMATEDIIRNALSLI